MGSLLADGMGALMSIYGAGSGAIRDPEVGKEWPGATNSTHQSDSAIGDLLVRKGGRRSYGVDDGGQSGCLRLSQAASGAKRAQDAPRPRQRATRCWDFLSGMNSAAVIGRQLRQQNRAPGPLAVPGRPRAPSHVNLGPLPTSVTGAAIGSSPHKDSNANKAQDDEDKQHSLIPAYVSLGCVWKFAKALTPGVLLIAIGTAMCVVGFLAEQLSTTVIVIDNVNNETSTTVNRSMEYHLHNLSFAGPAIMGLGGICIVAACVLTFGVKDHHHRVVPVDEKRPSIGEALVPILPLPPKGRRKPKPPVDAQAAAGQTPDAAPTVAGGSNAAPATLRSNSNGSISATTIRQAIADNNETNDLVAATVTAAAHGAKDPWSSPPISGVNAASNPHCHSNNMNQLITTNIHNSTTTIMPITNATNSSSNSSPTTVLPAISSMVSAFSLNSSTAITAKTTTILTGIHSHNVDSHNDDRKKSPSPQLASSAAESDGAFAEYPDPVHPDYRAYPDYPERYLADSAQSAAVLGDTGSGSGCSTPASNLSLPPILGSSGVWTCSISGNVGAGGIGGAIGSGLPQSASPHNSYNAVSASGAGSTPSVNHPSLGHQQYRHYGGGYHSYNTHLPGLSSGGAGRSSHVAGQASPYSSSNSSSNYSGAPPSSLSFAPLHMRTGATPPFKMRPAPSLSTSSTCTNFLLSPQYEATFIPSPTDLQILDPDGCDTPSSSKSFYMSRSASASSGLHLDMYLSRLPVSLRMQLSSKLFASMESDGLSSISTSDNDLAASNNTADVIVLRDFSKGGIKRTSFNSSVNKVGSSKATSTEDSQEVTPLLADDDSPATADSTPGSLGGGIPVGSRGVPLLPIAAIGLGAPCGGHSGGASSYQSKPSEVLRSSVSGSTELGDVTTSTGVLTPTLTPGIPEQQEQISHPLQHPLQQISQPLTQLQSNNSSSTSSFDGRFPLLRQAATESSRTLNGKLPSATAPSHQTINEPNQINQLFSNNQANSQTNSCMSNLLEESSPVFAVAPSSGVGVSAAVGGGGRSVSPLMCASLTAMRSETIDGISPNAASSMTASSVGASQSMSSTAVGHPSSGSTNNNSSGSGINTSANTTNDNNSSSNSTSSTRNSSGHALHNVPS
ncbi:uncharacterized protein LOC111261651 [Varroa jacobsoni]|uniref:uncharacterized protein LOC111261651 n=1 Tax=Varroa jacobsoni TaxID=62625 RepID=UPI000BF7F126|nr:uncharacterized protein LOC111261651 [Varroa jacobsoni]